MIPIRCVVLGSLEALLTLKFSLGGQAGDGRRKMPALPSIQYASDLHLEFFPRVEFETLLKPVAPILVLAGDIGPVGGGGAGAQRTRDFIAWCSERWRHVIWVFGNHEYYIMYAQKRWKFLSADKLLTMEEREAAARIWLATLPNVHFLQAESVVLEGIRFFGATLWSHVTEETHAAYGQEMADFKAIIAERQVDGNPVALTYAFRQALHARHLAALRAAMTAGGSEPLVVVTHHLPTGAAAPAIYHGEPTNPYYSNELWPELRSGSIAAWICGHSHGRTILEKPCLCVLNARGYPKQITPENLYSTTAVISLHDAPPAIGEPGSAHCLTATLSGELSGPSGRDEDSLAADERNGVVAQNCEPGPAASDSAGRLSDETETEFV